MQSNSLNRMTRFTNSVTWRFVRWIPITIILGYAGYLAVLFFRGGLSRVVAWNLLRSNPPILGLIFLSGVILYAVARRRVSTAIVITGIVALLSLSPALLRIRPVAYPVSIETTTPAVAVRLPTDGPLVTIWGGDNIHANYHIYAPDQRWAYDFAVEPYLIGSSELTDYGCYEVPVVAPAAGEVVAVLDGEPDTVPGVPSDDVQPATGNYVGLKLDETGTYLVIAHLKEGSVLVDVGEKVAEGEVIGQCGSSGSSSEPHIHLHHQRQDPSVYPTNFAEGLPLYFRDHDGPAMPEGGVYRKNGELVTDAVTIRHIGK